MQNLEKLLLRGYTIYINSMDGIITGTGIKCTEYKGTSLSSLSDYDIKYLTINYPSIIKILKKGSLLQIYRMVNFSYRLTLGNEVGEDPYTETQAFEVLEDLSSHSLNEGLIYLETESIELLQSKGNKYLNKMYRLYGKDKYDTYK